MNKIIRNIATIGLVGTLLSFTISMRQLRHIETEKLRDSLYKDSIEKVYIKDSIDSVEQTLAYRDSIYLSLVQEIQTYINHHSRGRSKVKPEKIVNLCMKHNFDLPLLLAQARIEGAFATIGRPRSTGSIFGVGLYDNGKTKKWFKNPNQSIEPYIKLVKYNYIRNRSINSVLLNGYKNHRGQRYASAPNYGRVIYKTRKEIIRKTKIDDLYNELKEV